MFHTPFLWNLKLFPKRLNNALLEKLIYTIMIKLNPKKSMGLTNLPFCFNAFVEKPPFPDMVESNGVEVIGLKYDFFKNCVVMGYFDELL